MHESLVVSDICEILPAILILFQFIDFLCISFQAFCSFGL